jgi:carboxyl-terminal processing protease
VGQAGKQYALLAQETIRRTDQTAMCGWIVDLRNNLGGTVWPMLIGVGPILGEGVVGSFVLADGSKQQWIYRNGQAFLDQKIQLAIGSAYHLKRLLPPVAVLTNGSTGSSGEAITVAFRGRPHTRSFGVPTIGVPTANYGYALSDGAVLELTTAFDADRTGRTYDSPIPPDQEVPSARISPPLADDPVVQAARIWLSMQEGCQG